MLTNYFFCSAYYSITYFENGGGDGVTNLAMLVELSEGQFESVYDLPIKVMFIKPVDGTRFIWFF